MAPPDEPSGARPGPVVLRIKLRYDDVELMVQRFAPNVGKSGLFLPTKAIQPIGTQVKFELRIADDTPVLVGLGKVVAVREPDPNHPRAASGMSIELMRVSREGGDMIKRMIAQRRALGLPMVTIPMAEDIDAARRDVETAPGGVVRDTIPQFASQPVAEQVFTAPRTDSGPVGIVHRYESGPVSAPIAALAPEPTKPKRPRIVDVIAKATELSGAVAVRSVPELDDNNIDVGRAIARARALAGGDVDAELAALREQHAAPIEIDIEAASAELARQLGGAAVIRKERSGVARWAPPPAVESIPSQGPSDSVSDATNGASDSQYEIVAPDAAETAVDPGQSIPFAAHIELKTDPGEIVTPVTPASALMIDDHVDPARFASALEGQRQEEHDLGDADIEPLDEEEHTMIGALPIDPEGFGGASYSSVPSAPADLADRLEAQLADAEAEAEQDFAQLQSTSYGEPSPLADEEDPAIELGAQRPRFGTESPLLYTQPGQAQPYQPEEELSIEEIDDVDVIAEADADDADLLSSDGEADASSSHEVAPPPEPGEKSYDFAANLDFGDDAPDPAEFDNERGGGFVSSFADDARASHDPFDPPSGGYTLAEDHQPADLELRRSIRPRVDEPRVLGAPPDPDLESALEALDPDLDDLSIPQADRGKPRATTDDGIILDFDDDEKG